MRFSCGHQHLHTRLQRIHPNSRALKELGSQNVSKEIFVTVDQPTEVFLETLKELEKENVNAKFIVNKDRVGKANACNNTVKLSTGKVLLFLDSDVGIPKDPDYLRKIIMEMQHTDILDIKKRVTKDKSFLSRMAYYEYLTFNISSWLASRYMHKCPAVNGAAFAIKREVFEKVTGSEPSWLKTSTLPHAPFWRKADFLIPVTWK